MQWRRRVKEKKEKLVGHTWSYSIFANCPQIFLDFPFEFSFLVGFFFSFLSFFFFFWLNWLIDDWLDIVPVLTDDIRNNLQPIR